jgi:acyl carrier protein
VRFPISDIDSDSENDIMIAEKVIEIIARATKRNPDEITPETELVALGMGSLDTITLLFEMEEAFDITIPNDAIPEITTVRDIIDNLEQHVTPSVQLTGSH